MRIIGTRTRLVIAAVAGTTLLGGGAAFASTTAGPPAAPPPAARPPAAGSVRVFVTSGTGAASPILLTGAIGDHGTATSTDKSGKKDPEGTYFKVALTKGAMTLNATALDARLNQAQPAADQATCSAWLTANGPVVVSAGTGRYAGVRGTVTMTVTLAFLAPRYPSGPHKGQCDYSTRPVSQYVSTAGSGAVTFR